MSVLAASHGQGPARTAVCLKLGSPEILMTNLLLLLKKKKKFVLLFE